MICPCIKKECKSVNHHPGLCQHEGTLYFVHGYEGCPWEKVNLQTIEQFKTTLENQKPHRRPRHESNPVLRKKETADADN
jgi:hypothetical protein